MKQSGNIELPVYSRLGRERLDVGPCIREQFDKNEMPELPYTIKHLADQILTSRSALEGERKIVTVLFADVANYTALSEKLDPEEVSHSEAIAMQPHSSNTRSQEGPP